MAARPNALIGWALSLSGWNMQMVKPREQRTFRVKPQALGCGEDLRLTEICEIPSRTYCMYCNEYAP